MMSARGWPEIEFDGSLLVSQQDALLMGGKVQAMPGFADHVIFRDAGLCIQCEDKTCIAMCSGQALTVIPCPSSSARNASTAAAAFGTVHAQLPRDSRILSFGREREDFIPPRTS